MRRTLIGVSVAVTVVLVGLFVAGAVFAQGPTASPNGAAPWGRGAGWTNSKAVTDLPGMTPGQLLDARLAGKTLLDIAKEKSVTEQQLTDALLAGRKDVLDQAVKDGRLTQTQADWMLERMKTMAPLQLTNPFSPSNDKGPRGGRLGGMGNGRFGGMNGGQFGGMCGGQRGNGGPWNTPAATPTPSGTTS